MLVAQKSLADLRVDLFAHVQRLRAAFFDRNPVGRLVTRLTTDVDVINEMFAAGALTILMDVVTLLGIVAIMLAIDWRLALVTPVAAAGDGRGDQLLPPQGAAQLPPDPRPHRAPQRLPAGSDLRA